MLLGIHIYMGGVGLQEFFILVFIFIAVRFQRKLSTLTSEHETFGNYNGRNQKGEAFRLLYVLYAVLTLITVRIVFRLIEYSNGVNSSSKSHQQPDCGWRNPPLNAPQIVPNHEAFMYCFDTLPMLIAIILFNIIHPGTVMPGRESDFPSHKIRRAAKKEAKIAKKQGKGSLDLRL
jgi:hypothetical protein